MLFLLDQLNVWNNWGCCSVTYLLMSVPLDQWNVWNNWGFCSVTYLLMSIPLDQWNVWNNWGFCSVTCGWGVRTRRRTCDGVNCVGNNQAVMDCDSGQECRGNH